MGKQQSQKTGIKSLTIEAEVEVSSLGWGHEVDISPEKIEAGTEIQSEIDIINQIGDLTIKTEHELGHDIDHCVEIRARDFEITPGNKLIIWNPEVIEGI